MNELQNQVPTGSFQCSVLSYAVPDEQFRFIERKMLQLNGNKQI
jgi:hypothetical protein